MLIPKPIKKNPWVTAICFIGVLLSLTACNEGRKNASETGDVKQVVIQTLHTQSVQDTLEVDGNTSAVQQVNLVARVAGVLERIHFKDGDKVRSGQVLFTIEQEPYIQQVKLNQAKVVQAKSDYARQVQLLKENATAQSSVESSLSNLEQAQANLRLAEINLGYTTIKAPFDGVISERALDIGNYVGASAGGDHACHIDASQSDLCVCHCGGARGAADQGKNCEPRKNIRECCRAHCRPSDVARRD